MKKKNKLFKSLFDKNKKYSINKAIKILLNITKNIYNKCINSIDISINIKKKKKILIRESLMLPYFNGKKYNILILTNNLLDIKKNNRKKIVKYIGGEKYIKKIKNKWLNFNMLITTPLFMNKISNLGKILGSKNLMPNPILGNITEDPLKAAQNILKGKIEIKMDKFYIINCSVGRSNFSKDKIKKNIIYLINFILNLRIISNNKTYIKNIFLSSTYSPSIKIKW
ncbi:MAG: 50S ribosomal protein L1 [Candidatus Shikimatogenerans sp. AspAUS03]|uniref:Large ribosomal subunit protein uL1 n=1 Tax=Candidatus Shikimatogenerans sp. AspAUS03 TaxID=3158563 RepID=A0AAU7QVA0_9FLAO